MFVLKGFITNARFTSNVLGTTAPLGEISTQSLTYAREKGLYKSTLSADLGLTTFLSAKNSVHTQLTTDVSDHIIKVAKFIYERSIAYNSEIFADELLQDLMTQFAIEAENFECGAIVSNGTIWMPEWITWKSNEIDSTDADNLLKVWFAEASFRDQYDLYEIVTVPPITPLNDFFKSGAEVQAMIDALVPSETMLNVQIAKLGYPESIIRSETFDYIDPLNANHRIPVTWNVLIYGAAGDNIDAVTDALVDYILDNSTHTREEWIAIFPEIFRRTEFVVMPLWDQYAIPNREIEAGIYSPVTNLKRAQALIKQVVVNYPGSHIDDNVALLHVPYKSLAMMAVGSPDNRNNWYRLTDVFPDFISVFSTNLDFSRMSLSTQGWINMIAEMLLVAEVMGPFSTIPLGMTKVVRDTRLYLVKRYGNINYLVLAKGSLVEEEEEIEV